MARSLNSELAQRINMAMSLLKKGSGKDEALAVMMQQFGVSRRQAYRYIQEARRKRREMPIPEEKVVFTVKLPKSLVSLIRRLADSSEDSLSNIVTQALRAFLRRRGHGREAS